MKSLLALLFSLNSKLLNAIGIDLETGPEDGDYCELELTVCMKNVGRENWNMKGLFR